MTAESNEFTADFLISVAESANIPRVCSHSWPWQMFEAADGWQVVVFYDADELDYIDHFVTPDGRKVRIWEWAESLERKRITDWPGEQT